MTVEKLSGHLKDTGQPSGKSSTDLYTTTGEAGGNPEADGDAQVGIPTVLDRFIQQAVMQALQRSWDGTFSEHSYGFQPKRWHIRRWRRRSSIKPKATAGVDLDLEKFFDRVNHDRLLAKIAERVSDKRLLTLIRAFCGARGGWRTGW